MRLDGVTLIAIAGHNKWIASSKKVLRHCADLCVFDKVKLFSPVKDSEFETVEIPYFDASLYSKFCIEELRYYIDTEYCLLVQSDGFIIDPSYWTNEFLDYDYIGAPWPHHDYAIGNGGFCLRSQKFLRATSKLSYTSHVESCPYEVAPEDWFAILHNKEHMQKEGIKYPAPELAYQFAVEHPSMIKKFNPYVLETYKSFGFHGPFNVAAMREVNE